jgi:predicted phage terminase large subunit-like protein
MSRFARPDHFDLTLKETVEFYNFALTEAAEDEEALRAVKRQLSQQDLFYLLTHTLGRADMYHPWLFERCREVQGQPDEVLDLWAREHYKSTIGTYGITILDIINNPEVTIGIFSYTKDLAEAFLQSVKTTLETNIELKYLFPDILWSNPVGQAPMWSVGDGIIVKRQSVRKEPTLSAWGLVNGMPTGMHFDVRDYDDVVTERSVTKPAMIKKTTDQWALSTSLGTEGGVARYKGTYYHLHDTYHEIQNRGVKTRIYPCTSDGSDDVTKAVFRTPEFLLKKKQEQGSYIFACQQLLNPLADNVQGFHDEWLRFWEANTDVNLNKALIVDPSSGKRGKQGNADNDYTSMWVIGRGGDGNWYVLDMIRDRLGLTKRAAAVMALHRRWKPTIVGYEDYGMQADIEHILDLQARENYRFDITPLGGGLSKNDRIKRLVPLFEYGRIYLPTSLIRTDWEGKATDLVRVFKEEEYSKFPVLIHDDMLDALSRICDEEISRLPTPEPKEDGWNAIKAYKRAQRSQRPVV